MSDIKSESCTVRDVVKKKKKKSEDTKQARWEKFSKKHQDALFDTSNGQSYKRQLSLCNRPSLNIQMFDLLIKSPW